MSWLPPIDDAVHQALHTVSSIYQDIAAESSKAVDRLKHQYEKLVGTPSREQAVTIMWTKQDGIRYPIHAPPTYNTAILLLEAARVYWASHASMYLPPVTTALVAANCAAFVKPGGWPLSAVALNPHMVWRHQQWSRLITSAFIHRDLDHLLSNLPGIIHFGSRLERAVGSGPYAAEVGLLTLLANSLFVLVGRAEAMWWNNSVSYYLHGLVGFSGVAFGLMVLDGYRVPGEVVVWSCRVPSKYACWVSLAMTTALMPHASLRAHMCGIGAALLLVFVPHGGTHEAAFSPISSARQLYGLLSATSARCRRGNSGGSRTAAGAAVRPRTTRSRYWRLPPLYGRDVAWQDLLMHGVLAVSTCAVGMLAHRLSRSH